MAIAAVRHGNDLIAHLDGARVIVRCVDLFDDTITRESERDILDDVESVLNDFALYSENEMQFIMYDKA